MASFHLRRDPEGAWRWRLVDEDGRVLAISPGSVPTRGECLATVEEVRRVLGNAHNVVDTTLPRVGGRWREIDLATGETGGPSEAVDEEYDEGETGPPEAVVEKSPSDAA